MIRILHVVTYMGRGGLETMLMNYYRHIDREQVQFDFLVHRAFRADFDDEIEALGGRIYRLPRLVPWSPSYLQALNRFFEEHPAYQIVHVHQDCLSAVILKAAKQHGVPVRIAHAHSSNQDKNLLYPIKLFYKRFIPQYATELFACGKEAGDWMFGGAHFQILNNAIDAQRYQYSYEAGQKVRANLGIPETCFVIGHVGRFSPAKNHDRLLRIYHALNRRCSNTKLLLVGDGDLRKNIEAQISQMNLQEDVILTGRCLNVPDMLCAMDVFVFPSRYEGFGIAVLEAQATGLPCVITDTIPPECIIADNVSQLSLRASEDVWTEAVLRIGEAKRERAWQNVRDKGFDIRLNAQELQRFYCEKYRLCQQR